MPEIKEEILNDLFSDLRESESISSEFIETLQSLLTAENNPTAETLVKVFEKPNERVDNDPA